MILTIKSVYTNEILEQVEVEDYFKAEDYVFNKYNCCWNIEHLISEIVAEVYER